MDDQNTNPLNPASTTVEPTISPAPTGAATPTPTPVTPVATTPSPFPAMPQENVAAPQPTPASTLGGPAVDPLITTPVAPAPAPLTPPTPVMPEPASPTGGPIMPTPTVTPPAPAVTPVAPAPVMPTPAPVVPTPTPAVTTPSVSGAVAPAASAEESTEGKGAGKYLVRVINNKCIGAASCVAVAPNAFKLNDKQIAEVLATTNQETDDNLLLAAQSCPTLAIEVIDTETGQKVWPK